MCFACGQGGGTWPWSQAVHLAAPPVKEEHIFLDSTVDFYPDYRTGIHAPAPIYQSNQPAQPAQSMYYYQGAAAQPAGYYNGYYYGAGAPATGWQLTSSSYSPYSQYPYSFYSAPSTALVPYSAYSSYQYPSSACNYSTWSSSAPSPYSALSYYSSSPYYAGAPAMPYGWPGAMPSNPWCPQAAMGQAQAYLSANAALAAAPQAPYYFVGSTPAEIQAQNAYIAANIMQMPQIPTQLVPFKPGSSQQFWVKELDGSWTLREHNDIVMGELGAGHWERHATSGYYYYVRHPA